MNIVITFLFLIKNIFTKNKIKVTSDNKHIIKGDIIKFDINCIEKIISFS